MSGPLSFLQPPIPNVAAIKDSCGDAKGMDTGRAGDVLTWCTQHWELTVALYLLHADTSKRGRDFLETKIEQAETISTDAAESYKNIISDLKTTLLHRKLS